MRHNIHFRICLILCLAVALAGVVLPASAQQVTAAFTGTVVDPSGAPIVNATVTAMDTERGVVYTTKTNDQGLYSLPRIPVGTYKLEIEATGFQKSTHSGLVLVLNQTARVDVKLKIGQASESVEVSGAAPLLQTDTTALGTIIDGKINETLPLATRNYVQLTLLTPGAVTPDPASMTTGQDMTTSGRPYINGNREQANNFMLDGMDNNQVGDNEVGFSPSVDAIQEFNLISQNASAEFGNFQGGIVSTSIKSGTNGFHGDVFEFFRNDVLNANSWQNGLTDSPKDPLRWNMFGATFGGPIVRNKLFFFMDYQGQRQVRYRNSEFSLIPTTVRGGDLSSICSEGFNSAGLCNNLKHQIYNPLNVVGGVRQPFLNNQIPTTMFSPVVNNLFASKYYPTPSIAGDINNFSGVTHSVYNNDQGDLKIDYNISDKDRLFARWSQMYLNEPVNSSWAIANTGANITNEPAKELRRQLDSHHQPNDAE